jgi:hypothetical protein
MPAKTFHDPVRIPLVVSGQLHPGDAIARAR